MIDRVLNVLGEQVIIRRDPGGGVLDASVIEEIVPPGFAAPMHRHQREDEIFYIIDGVFRIWRGGEVFDVSSGGVVFLPRNQIHTFMNIGSEPGRLLTVVQPAGLEGFFEALADRNVHQDDEDAIIAVAAEFGLEIIGPPPSARGLLCSA